MDIVDGNAQFEIFVWKKNDFITIKYPYNEK